MDQRQTKVVVMKKKKGDKTIDLRADQPEDLSHQPTSKPFVSNIEENAKSFENSTRIEK